MKRTPLFLLLCSLCASAYDPPIGIPDPAARWGVFGEIDQAAPAWPASWTGPGTSATADKYYIDNTDGGATDSGNPYGHPDVPRLTIPEGSLNAGAFIYVHAGTYVAGGDRFDWFGSGTAASPIWITGNAAVHPILSEFIHLGSGGPASYFVIEKLDRISGSSQAIRITPSIDGDNIDHVLLRDCLYRGDGDTTDGEAISVSLSQTTDSTPNSTVSDIVIYNMEVTEWGDTGATKDNLGVANGFHTDHVYVLDSHIHSIGGDAVAGSHYNNGTTRLSTNYFIGRNHLHNCGENSIDLKGIWTGVISENDCHGPYFRESGTCVVLHSGANPEPCVDVQTIFNTLHDAGGGVATGGSVGNDNMAVVGNVIWNVGDAWSPDPDVINSNCVQIGGSDGAMIIADNTFYNYDEGINLSDLDPADTVAIHGNVFGSIHTNVSRYELVVTGDETLVSTDYNFYPPGADFDWDGADRDLAYMQGTAGEEANSLSGDPLFANAAGDDFQLQSGSPARDVSVEGPVGATAYDAFQALIGIAIEVDILGVSRPQDSIWDMGAYEFITGPAGSTLSTGTLTIGP